MAAGSPRHGQQEDRDHAGIAAVDDEAVVAEGLRSEGEMVSHNVGRPRGAEAGVCRVFLVEMWSRSGLVDRAAMRLVCVSYFLVFSAHTCR